VKKDVAPVAPEERKVAEHAFGGGGKPLPEKERTDLEQKLGADLSAVRVHTGVEAGAAAKSVQAHAFTVGADIAFAPGKYDPESTEGRRLLTHEIAHTLQQDSGKVIRRDGETATDAPAPDWSLLDQIKKINDYSWVAPWDESELESLWGQFGDALPSVYDSGGKTDWDISIDKGAELWDIKQVSLAQDQFRNAVGKVAEGYLDENAALVEKERGALGPEHGPPSEDQINATQERREAAEQVKLARKAVAAFGLIHVGYDNVGFGDVRKPFYPNRPPQKRPKGDEDPPLPTWEQTKEQYDRAQLVIDAHTSKFPSLYAIERDSGAESVATTESKNDNEVRVQMLQAMDSTLANIEKTRPKIWTDFAWELKPIHVDLLAAAPWDSGFMRDAADRKLKEYGDAEFWTTMGLSLAAAAFVIASMATGGLAAAALLGAGAGIGVGTAASSIDKYIELRTAQRSSLSKDTALVYDSQVSGALATAILDVVFAFLDVYSAAKAIGIGAKATAATVEAATKAETKAVAGAITEIGTKEAETLESAVKAGRVAEVTDEALKAEKYFLEVVVEEGGKKHVYRRTLDGKWCRFGSKVCGVPVPASLETMAAKAAQKITDPAAAAVREVLESTEHQAAMKALEGVVKGTRTSLLAKWPLLAQLSDGAIQRVVRAGYAQATGGGLRSAVRGVSAAKGQLLEELAAVRIRKLLADPAGKTALGLGHIAEEVHFIEGARVRTIEGLQLTDGVLVVQRGKELEIVGVLESKAGAFSSKGLTESLVSLRRSSASDIAEALRDMSRTGTGKVTGMLKRIQGLDPDLAGKILRHEDIDKEVLMGVLDKLTDAEIKSIRTAMGVGEGQITKDVERLMEGAMHDGLMVDGKLVPVKKAGRPQFYGALPKDVPAAPIEKTLTEQGYKFHELPDAAGGMEAKDLNNMASDLVKNVGPELEKVMSTTPPPAP
jgi:hypothetical protein